MCKKTPDCIKEDLLGSQESISQRWCNRAVKQNPSTSDLIAMKNQEDTLEVIRRRLEGDDLSQADLDEINYGGIQI